MSTIPSPTRLLRELDISLPVIGVYDTPEPEAFDDVSRPSTTAHTCVFAFFRRWKKGKTARLEVSRSGCFGCGYWLFGEARYSRESFADFLVQFEGVKANRALMKASLARRATYRPEHGRLMIGPLCDLQYAFLKTATFFVTPDQLAVLIIAAQTHSAVGDTPPTIAPAGSGCAQLLPLFDDLTARQAIVGGTDVVMRRYLPPTVLAFTVTKNMFEHLCSLRDDSLLTKPALEKLLTSRKRQARLATGRQRS